MLAPMTVLERWGRRVSLDPLDLWFLALRAGTFAAGAAWWALDPQPLRAPPLVVLGVFASVSVALYVYNAVRPGRIARLYRVALVADLLLVFMAVRSTGGFASELHLAFILLIALHAFYFGFPTGLVVATTATVLYALAVGFPLPQPAFALRAGFFGLVGLTMGLVAEQRRRRQQALDQQQQQLLHSDRLATVGELAAGLVHELRNPLAGIAGALHVLAGRLASGDDSHALLADVQVQIARMNGTLTNLLHHARPPQPQRIEVEINAVLDQSLQFLPRGGIEVVRRFGSRLPPVQVDPTLLHQAFLNILVNARQAMPRGGRLTLETGPANGQGRGVEITISDTGTGIAPEHLDRIFQPFFTTKSQGTGLGLAIAARVVEQHGGRIAVESRAGAGATFRVVLPETPRGEWARRDAHATQTAGR